MSWSETSSDLSLADVHALKPRHAATKDNVDQFEAAKAAAIELINSGVVGSNYEQRYHVGLHGHGNPGHKPAEGWANDSVTVTVTQV